MMFFELKLVYLFNLHLSQIILSAFYLSNFTSSKENYYVAVLLIYCSTCMWKTRFEAVEISHQVTVYYCVLCMSYLFVAPVHGKQDYKQLRFCTRGMHISRYLVYIMYMFSECQPCTYIHQF